MSRAEAAPGAANIEALPYRRGVGILLLDRRGQVFVAQRIDTAQEAWQMPQGGIDPGETPRAAALRELAEETGTAKARILAESRDWLRYDLPPDLVPRVWRGRFRGQEQKWFAMQFEGRDADIRLDTGNPEFKVWRWAALEDLPALIVAFKRPLYLAVVEEFRDLVDGLRTPGR